MHTTHPMESVNSVQLIGKTPLSEMSGCFALVWARGVSKDQESGILQDVEAIEGVISVQFSRKDPYILLASYDPDITNTAKILKSIDRKHIQTRIVGC